MQPTRSPWYRQFWPWFIMAFPASAVIAGVATVIIAVKNPDGLVDDDYYKSGLAINKVLARAEEAARLGLQAQATWTPTEQSLTVELHGKGPFPDRLRLRLVHPTRAGFDQEIPLLRQADGRYRGLLAHRLPPGNWHLRLEPLDAAWRLSGRARLPDVTAWQLAP